MIASCSDLLNVNVMDKDHTQRHLTNGESVPETPPSGTHFTQMD